MTTALEPTLSPQDIAALTGVSYQGVLAEIHAGRLRAAYRQGRYLVTVENYRAWLDPDDVAPVSHRAPAAAPVRSTCAPGAGSVAALTAIERGARA